MQALPIIVYLLVTPQLLSSHHSTIPVCKYHPGATDVLTRSRGHASLMPGETGSAKGVARQCRHRTGNALTTGGTGDSSTGGSSLGRLIPICCNAWECEREGGTTMCHMPSGPVMVLCSVVAATGDREEVGYCLAQACGNLRLPGTGALAACRFVTHEEMMEMIPVSAGG